MLVEDGIPLGEDWMDEEPIDQNEFLCLCGMIVDSEAMTKLDCPRCGKTYEIGPDEDGVYVARLTDSPVVSIQAKTQEQEKAESRKTGDT